MQAFTARFVPSMQNLYRTRHKTARRDLQGLFLQLYPFNRPRNQTDTSGYNAVCATLEHIHAPGRHSAYTRYQRHDERHTGQHSRPIIIMYIRGQRCALVMYPCQTVQHIADHASPAGSRCFPRLALAWHRVSLALCFLPGTGGAEPLTATAAALFGLSPDNQ